MLKDNNEEDDMGFFKKLFGFAAVKVADKVKENNPDGVQDVNEDGKVDYKDYIIETKKAAKETFAEAKEKIEEKFGGENRTE